MSKPLVITHAGDDSDGRIWGIEGINLLFVLAGLPLRNLSPLIPS